MSDSKYNWEPALIQTWLGHIFNMTENRLYVTEAMVAKLKESLSVILANPYAVTFKQLAQVTGLIISMSKAIGLIAYLHTSHLYYTIEMPLVSPGI